MDQALGVLIAIHRTAPAAGFEVLREVSQHTSIKLHAVAEMVVDRALGQSLPEPVERELCQAVQRRPGQDGAPGRPR
ncbi:ANTAR domain-containing protein [Streptomyces sp. SLBN-115]|uniref:ANTAR domain-containing protein n=1 Tax=Streptomyces sp. SLBN-115 TaxID=2768453 RepID=UPI001F182C67|nr:ANTAR domain-containing protein [Streptomyces sp. SLBN-115]